MFVNGGPRGVVGGLRRAIVVELTRGGAGGVPLDTARSTLVSNLFVGEAPRAMARRVGLCRGAMAQEFEDPFIVLP